MDSNPDLVASVAVEAWLMARTQALRTGNPGLTHDDATTTAIDELKTRYPALGGTLRHLTIQNTFGTAGPPQDKRSTGHLPSAGVPSKAT